MTMTAAKMIVVVLLLLGEAAHADQCPQPQPDPGAELLRPLDTPEFRAQLRRGHAWRETTGDVGEYFSRLEVAAFLGEVDLVKQLIDRRAVPQGVLLSAASLSIYSGHKEILVLLFDEAGVSPDARFGDVPLIVLASAAGHADVLREFLDRKADMYAKDGEVPGRDTLLAAIMNHQQQSVATLLAAGFDQSRSRTKNGLTPIELARRLKNPCIEKLLSD
jgi:ankyrin repeat protein